MLGLLAPRLISGIRGRYRRLELEDADFRRAGEVLAQALEGGRRLTRPAAFRLLDHAGVSTEGQRGIHILQRLALEGLICFGPREGKQHTFVLLDEWAPQAPELGREQALAELARRFFAGHGPATLRDFSWWSGLSLTDARTAVDIKHSRFVTVSSEGTEYLIAAGTEVSEAGPPECHLLPPFDEYLVAYADRTAVLDAVHARRVNNRGGLLSPAIVVGGRVVGTWKRSLGGRDVAVMASPFESVTPAEQESIALAAERYAAFLGLPLRLTIGEA
jgi:winged helix DNA-binding protein